MQFAICHILPDCKPKSTVIEAVGTECDNPVDSTGYTQFGNPVLPHVPETDSPVFLDGTNKTGHAFLVEIVVEYDAVIEIWSLPYSIIEYEGINQRAPDTSIFIQFLNPVSIVTPVAGNLYVELPGNNPSVLLESSPSIILPVFIQSGPVPLTIDFLVSDSIRACASDNIDEPYVSSYL